MAQMRYAEAVCDALRTALSLDEKVMCYGLGVTDPKGIFGTTSGLWEKFGPNRVFDVPISENALTGIGLGLGIEGFRPVMVHQRLDFFLLAMDQLVNGAAKWHYMFGGTMNVPITIRLVIGRGWGQGPTHSQNLQSWFAHIPGLKVVAPTTPADAKGLLLSSIFDENPVIFIEHRWLHNQVGEVPEGDHRVPLASAHAVAEGGDLTIVGDTMMVIEALRANQDLRAQGIHADIIDLRSISPIDWPMVMTSIKKTGRLMALDTGAATCSVAGEIIARATMNCFGDMKVPPTRIAMPDVPVPTSRALTKDFYPDHHQITATACAMMGKPAPVVDEASPSTPHDVPGDWFKGPF